MLARRAALTALALALIVPLVQPAAASEFGTWGTPARSTTSSASQRFNDLAVKDSLIVAISTGGTDPAVRNTQPVKVDYSLNKGQTWVTTNLVTATGAAPVSIAIVNTTTWLAGVAADGPNYSGGVNVYKTTDSGTTWTLKGTTPVFTSGQGGSTCLPVGEGQQGHDIAYDAGTNTILVARAMMYMANCNAGTNIQRVFGVWKSVNDGVAWTNTVPEATLYSASAAPFVAQPPELYVRPGNWNVVVTPGTGNLRYYQTRDNGTTAWTSKTLPESGTLNAVSATVWSNGATTEIVGKHQTGASTWSTFRFNRNSAGTWSGGDVVSIAGGNAQDRDTLFQDGARLWHLARELSGNPIASFSEDNGASWKGGESVSAKFSRRVELVPLLGGMRAVGFDFDSPYKLETVDRSTLFYTSAKVDRGQTFPRGLADLETNREAANATRNVYVREIGTGQLGTSDGRILRLDSGLHVIKATDPCTGDYASPGSLRGLRYTWDKRIVTVCENNVESPSQADLVVMVPDLSSSHIYGYAQTETLGPFLIRSTGTDSVAYATFGNVQRPSQVRFDHAQQHVHVRHDALPNLQDAAMDEGGNYDKYAAISTTGLSFYSTSGQALDTFDEATFDTGGTAVLVKGPIVHVLSSAGVQRFNYPGGSINKVQGGLNPLTAPSDVARPVDQGTMKWSKDHQYVIIWSGNHVWILTGAGLGTVYETPRGLFPDLAGCPVRAADMDFANNYLYVATCNDVLELPVYDYTTSTGDDSNPPGTPNNPPDPLDDPANDDPAINQDTDDDGLTDTWELDNFGNLTQGPDDDPDGDGATNAQEESGGTSPTDDAEIPPPDTSGGGGGGGGGAVVQGSAFTPMVGIIAGIAAVLTIGILVARRKR